jgi:hypothetical protein
VVSSSTGPILSSSNLYRARSSSTEHNLLMLASPRMRRSNSRARLPHLQLRNVRYNKTTLRSGCTLFLTRVSKITARQTIHALQTRVPKERVSRSTRDTPRTLNSVYLQIDRIIFQNNGSFLSTRKLSLGIHADYH